MRSTLFWNNTFLRPGLLFQLLLFITGSFSWSPAGSQGFTLLDEFPHIKGFVAQDALDNRFAIENGVLKKILPNGETITFSNRQFGHVTSVDVSDPLNIIAFFKDFGVVVVLDRNLAEKNTIPATQLHDTFFPSQICFSGRHGFWAYFPDAFRLARYNFRPQVDIWGEDLSLMHPPDDVQFMQESNDKLFLAGNGVWVFDFHANFLFHIAHIRANQLQVKENKIFYINEDLLYVYDFFLKKETVFLLPETRVNSFFVKNNQIIYLQTDESLKTFRMDEKLY